MNQAKSKKRMFISDVVKRLIILNILVYVVSKVLFPALAPYLAMHYPFEPPVLTPDERASIAAFESVYLKNQAEFKPVQLVTYMFMHGNLNHLFTNMIGLFIFGPLVEMTLGRERFLIYYLLTGFGALALHIGLQWYDIHINTNLDIYEKYMVSKSTIVGASGAVFGVTAAIGVLMPRAGFRNVFIPIEFPAWMMVVAYLGIELYQALHHLTPGVAHWAHIGGAVFGILILFWWKWKRRID